MISFEDFFKAYNATMGSELGSNTCRSQALSLYEGLKCAGPEGLKVVYDNLLQNAVHKNIVAHGVANGRRKRPVEEPTQRKKQKLNDHNAAPTFGGHVDTQDPLQAHRTSPVIPQSQIGFNRTQRVDARVRFAQQRALGQQQNRQRANMQAANVTHVRNLNPSRQQQSALKFPTRQNPPVSRRTTRVNRQNPLSRGANVGAAITRRSNTHARSMSKAMNAISKKNYALRTTTSTRALVDVQQYKNIAYLQRQQDDHGSRKKVPKRRSRFLGVLPLERSNQWFGVIQYRKKPNSPVLEKKTKPSETEHKVVEWLELAMVALKGKGYILQRADYGKRLPEGQKQICTLREQMENMSPDELKRFGIRKSKRRNRTKESCSTSSRKQKASKWTGVHWDSKSKRWRAVITVKGDNFKQVYKGTGSYVDDTMCARAVNRLCRENGLNIVNPGAEIAKVQTISTRRGGRRKNRYIGIYWKPDDEQWHCELKYKKNRKPNTAKFIVNDGHGFWDTEEDDCAKIVTKEVEKLKAKNLVIADYAFGEKKKSLAELPLSKHVGLVWDIDHGRWKCSATYFIPNNRTKRKANFNYESDEESYATDVRSYVQNQSKNEGWIWELEYGRRKTGEEMENAKKLHQIRVFEAGPNAEEDEEEEVQLINEVMRPIIPNQQQREQSMQEKDKAPATDKELFEVEKILESRMSPEGREYLVKWASTKKHAAPEHTWEPEDHVKHLDIFQEFHRKLLQKSRKRLQEQQEQMAAETGSVPPLQGIEKSKTFKGVFYDPRDKKWHASVTVNGNYILGGSFGDENNAALAVNTLCVQNGIPILNPHVADNLRAALFSNLSSSVSSLPFPGTGTNSFSSSSLPSSSSSQINNHNNNNMADPEVQSLIENINSTWIQARRNVFLPTETKMSFPPECTDVMPPLEIDPTLPKLLETEDKVKNKPLIEKEDLKMPSQKSSKQKTNSHEQDDDDVEMTFDKQDEECTKVNSAEVEDEVKINSNKQVDKQVKLNSIEQVEENISMHLDKQDDEDVKMDSTKQTDEVVVKMDSNKHFEDMKLNKNFEDDAKIMCQSETDADTSLETVEGMSTEHDSL